MNGNNHFASHLRVVSRDPAVTTGQNIAQHLRGSDAITRITAALVDAGIPQEVAHEQAIRCWRELDPSYTAIVAFACAEAVWRESVGDDFALRSFVNFAESGPGARDQANKIRRHVDLVLHTAAAFFSGRASSSERARAAAHLALWQHGPISTLQDKANRILARRRTDVSGNPMHESDYAGGGSQGVA